MSKQSLNRTLDRVLIDADKGLYFRPLFDRVVVKPKRTRDKTDGGIIIPETAKIEESMGTVVAVGHGRFDENGHYVDTPLFVKIGDTIVYKEFTGLTVRFGENDKETYRIIWERDILGILSK